MRIVVLTLALCLFPVVAFAEQGSQCPDGQQDCVEYTFDGDEVDGNRNVNGLDSTRGTRGGAHERLIRVRTDFYRELYKSVESI